MLICSRYNELLILPKGHAAPLLYAAYAGAGIIKEKELLDFRKITSNLEGHPTPRMPFVKIATGSLGQGLSNAVGIALAKKLAREKGITYVLLGDGECAEGSIWEAANIASYYKLTNICAIVDVNNLGQSQPTMHPDIEVYEQKFRSFGWQTEIIDGHNIINILNALQHAQQMKQPLVILAKTIKGKGVSFLENKENWHGKALLKEELEKALKELGTAKIKLHAKITKKQLNYPRVNINFSHYKKGDMISTREAFGKALLALGKKNKKVIALDGDVKNSTKTDNFFQNFPERSFQCFIAEQNMVGMATGFSAQGFIPVVATFAAFLTRAHDQIRMARYSAANIKFIGSHAGINVGEDGPSQMGLEDIGLFLTIPQALVLYPSDAHSTQYLLQEMAKHQGISYLRLTRGSTPVIYERGEEFPLGKLKVLCKSFKDKALVIGAGITVHEALNAYHLLKKKDIAIRVIDLYSIQPLDERAL
ncbi:transketolase, partial [Candidatus Woesearchaeota archaeon]|nr:transketolase [Candidatus Woesearchaeota archaeon]